MLHDLLDKAEGSKYQITVKILFKKYESIEIEFSPVYFNSTTKKELYTEPINGSIKDLVGLLKRFILSALKFQLLDHYQRVFTLNHLLN